MKFISLSKSDEGMEFYVINSLKNILTNRINQGLLKTISYDFESLELKNSIFNVSKVPEVNTQKFCYKKLKIRP